MMALFDEEKIMRTHVASEKKETARKAAEKMLKLGKLSAEEIAGCFTELSVEDIQEIEKGLFQTEEAFRNKKEIHPWKELP